MPLMSAHGLVANTKELTTEPDMPITPTPRLPGQETLLGSWGALMPASIGSHLMYTRTSFAAVYPNWAPLNNAVLLDPPSRAAASEAASELHQVYSGAGVSSWALWLPGRARDFDAADSVTAVEGMVRDTSTLAMASDLTAGMPSHPGVLRTTVHAADVAGGRPIPADAVPDPDDSSDVDGWVLIYDEYAVAGAWTFRNGSDVGVYAVGTAPDWRRRGLARALMLHVLADGRRRGARTASLQSTRMGQPLYAQLGFRPVGRYDEWIPADRRQGEAMPVADPPARAPRELLLCASC